VRSQVGIVIKRCLSQFLHRERMTPPQYNVHGGRIYVAPVPRNSICLRFAKWANTDCGSTVSGGAEHWASLFSYRCMSGIILTSCLQLLAHELSLLEAQPPLSEKLVLSGCVPYAFSWADLPCLVAQRDPRRPCSVVSLRAPASSA
jgi:hypothetical protein